MITINPHHEIPAERQKLTPKQRLRIQMRHKRSIEQHGYKPQALYWSSAEIQKIRFKQLMKILPEAPLVNQTEWSVLDVGCGFADLLNVLNENQYYPCYFGLDISGDMVAAAKCLHPDIKTFKGELKDFDWRSNRFDFVFLSGALNEVVETDLEGIKAYSGVYARSVIFEMYRIAKKGVSFNLLDSRHLWTSERVDLQSFEPHSMVNFCSQFADQVELIEGYLENDFTILLTKEARDD
jgi:SAM-dependent methyltransferase